MERGGPQIITRFVPRKDFELYERLSLETHTTPIEVVLIPNDSLQPDYPWFNSDVKDPEMVVRGIIRDSTLVAHGRDIKETYEEWASPEPDQQVDPDRITEIAGEPDFIHYYWHRTSDTMLGSFEDLNNLKKQAYFEDLENGVVLFSDEWDKLQNGEKVVTLHSAGFGLGYLVEIREVYKVIDGDLHRIRASIAD